MKKLVLLIFILSTILYGNESQWGEDLPGIIRKIKTDEKIVFLTLDACGSKTDSYDKKLIDFLIEEKIETTLFLSGRWIKKFPLKSEELNKIDLFDIENHGLNHKPCSIDGKSVYGIEGTKSREELIEECIGNKELIEDKLNKKTRFYRSGTAYYDTEAVEIIKDEFKINIIGFAILADAGASYSKEETYEETIKAKFGDIIIAHMNRPEKESSKGLIKALIYLKKQGYQFRKIKDYIEKL